MLTGIRMEYSEGPEMALAFYNELLEADSTNAVRSTLHLLTEATLC